MKPGEIVAQKYVLVSSIGQGGMGVVWRAESRATGREFAIKFLHSVVAASEESRLRFVQEARASARINHPAIIDVFDLGVTDDGTLFMVMELLDGISLSEALRATPPFTIRELCLVLAETCAALVAAHAAGVVHRDIKPANIFLHRDRTSGHVRAKVLDFGVSKVMSGDDRIETTTGSLLGSPRYMSPEQARNASLADARADIWSLGVVMFEALTGRFPHEADNSHNLIVAIAMEPPKSITEVAPRLPSALRQVVDDCLAPLAKRIGSAAELLERISMLSESPEVVDAPLARPRAPRGKAVARPVSFELQAAFALAAHDSLSDTSAKTARGPHPDAVTLPYSVRSPSVVGDLTEEATIENPTLERTGSRLHTDPGTSHAGLVRGRSERPALMLSARILLLIVKIIQSAGHDSAALCRRHGVVIDEGPYPMGKMRLADFPALFEDAARLLGRPNLGLDMASSMELGSYGLIEFMIRSVATVREGSLELCRYGELVNTGVEFRLEGTTLIHSAPGSSIALGRHGNEYTLALVLHFTREISGEHICPRAIELAHPEPSDRAALEAFFGTDDITFGAGINKLHYEPADLERPVMHRDPALHAFLNSQLQAALQAKAESDESIGSLVRREIRATLDGGVPSIERVAERLSTTAASLERRLQDQGESFDDLVDIVREDLAYAYLGNPALGLSEVGYLLGYRDLCSFESAFSRWTAKTPAEWQNDISRSGKRQIRGAS